MAELHRVDVTTIEWASHGNDIEIGLRTDVRSWVSHARDVLALPVITPAIRKELDLVRFQARWESYMKWLKAVKADRPLVLCHNDVLYNNILRLNRLEEGTAEHHQIIIVDYEYACPNPAAFDIANHFHEWTTNYHGPTPHLLDPSRYPNDAERRTFLTAYLENRTEPHGDAPAFQDLSPAARERELAALGDAVRLWSPASHALWLLWGLVQAREDLLAHVAQPEFDYIDYARGRMAAFYRELAALGV